MCVCVFKFGSVTAVLKSSVCLFPTVTLNSRNGATPTAGSDDGEGKAVRKTDNKIPEGDLLLQVSSELGSTPPCPVFTSHWDLQRFLPAHLCKGRRLFMPKAAAQWD